tara:strand:- start:108 stop:1052 length:945 start_codon:yes stop_codon:yes gene_type:complete
MEVERHTRELENQPLNLNHRHTTIQSHIRIECLLAKQFMICTLIHWLCYVYWAEIVFRNLTFIRVEQAILEDKMLPARLLDLGHDVTSGNFWTQFGKLFSERPIFLLSFYTLLLPIISYIMKSRPIYVCNILARYDLVMSAGHIFRFMCYISTTLPGSAEQCVASTKDDFIKYIGPRIHHGIDIYTKAPTYPGNCGDLIFSGHMLLLVLLTKVSSTYTYSLFHLHTKWNLLFQFFIFVLFITQILGTLAQRNHYTIDVIIGIFIAFFLDEKVTYFLKSSFFNTPQRSNMWWFLLGVSPILHIAGRGWYALNHFF